MPKRISFDCKHLQIYIPFSLHIQRKNSTKLYLSGNINVQVIVRNDPLKGRDALPAAPWQMYPKAPSGCRKCSPSSAWDLIIEPSEGGSSITTAGNPGHSSPCVPRSTYMSGGTWNAKNLTEYPKRTLAKWIQDYRKRFLSHEILLHAAIPFYKPAPAALAMNHITHPLIPS
jgi:hypothetical protein